MSKLGFIRVKGIALAVTDLDRANRFYGETLALPPDTIRNMESAYAMPFKLNVGCQDLSAPTSPLTGFLSL